MPFLMSSQLLLSLQVSSLLLCCDVSGSSWGLSLWNQKASFLCASWGAPHLEALRKAAL